jgi:hypothetical protein
MVCDGAPADKPVRGWLKGGGADLFEDFPHYFAELHSENLKLRPRQILGELTMMLVYVARNSGAGLFGGLVVTSDKRCDASRQRIAF